MTEAPETSHTKQDGPTPARSSADLTRRNVDRMARLDAAARAKATTADRVADAIASLVGSIRFAWLSVIMVGGWVVLNMFLPRAERVDPFPFPLLTLVLSVEAIFLSICILMSQNRAARISDRRSQLDLQLNVLSEQENTKMIEMLEEIGRLVGAKFGESQGLRALEEAIEPETLIRQIERSGHSRDDPSPKEGKSEG